MSSKKKTPARRRMSWRRYEVEKQALAMKGLSPQEYERQLRAIARRLRK